MSLLTLTFSNTLNKYVQQQSVPQVYEFVGSNHKAVKEFKRKREYNRNVIQLLISIYYHIKKSY